jgi:molybdenum ABC transporter molybdate-binding protein
MTWTVKADVYAAGMKRVKQMVDKGFLVSAEPYATNNLTIMIPKGNPAHITSLKDLGKPGVKLVMPNPAFEGIARQIKAARKKAGGDELVKMVYETKVKNGETILTHIHHRQSPMFLMMGKADAGVTWGSEAIFQEKHAGNPIAFVKIAPEHNSTAVYAAGVLKDAPNPEAAKAWVDFLKSPKALAIFEQYGFKPYHH